ncbi:MAG: aminopeptidase [Flavobacterium sp.]|nr:aminopeptidase [Flavobacterium sp.]
MDVVASIEAKALLIKQELTFYNQSTDTLNTIILNDWNNAYSDKNSPLGKRFSDEFVRSFHLSTEKERGTTANLIVSDDLNTPFVWNRVVNQPDLVEIQLKNKLLPNQKIILNLNYTLKIPSNKFTGYGYNSKGDMSLKNWFLTPARYENHQFVKYSNLNIDDAVNAVSTIDLQIKVPENFNAVSDLIQIKKEASTIIFSGTNVVTNSLYVESKPSFSIFKNENLEVVTNFQDNKVHPIQKAIIVDKIVNYVSENMGHYAKNKIIVSQQDYDENPFYGLNQLPSFISPFTNDYLFEMKFLKTFLNNYLKTTMQIDSRKDNWIFDAIQIYYMMKYVDEFYPNAKMMGSIAKLKVLKGFHLISLDFNEQYSYFYMLMARKNLDQSLGNSKDELIKFNEKIASKYRAGLSFRYLDSYLGNGILQKTISDFMLYSYNNQTDHAKFESILKEKTPVNINWFFDTVINSRELIDYKFDVVSKSNETVSLSIKNKTQANVPIPIYGLNKKKVVFKQWIGVVKPDSIYTFQRFNADKIVINYKNEVPEYNLRNNWKTLKPFNVLNKPLKFNFLKDLEDPYYNQILYVPTLEYNLYDGFIGGMRFHNRTILDKPFNIDVTPSYSTKSQSFSGRFSTFINQYNRDGKLYNIRYGLSGEYFHYAPDAYYKKFTPYVSFRFRENDYRDNKKQFISLRGVNVNRDPSQFVKNTFEGSYSVFDARFSSVKTEITRHFAYSTDFQISKDFGKASIDIGFRRLFDNNRQINLRLYAGTFLYNATTTSYFNFSLDRPTDYLFDYNYLGRSEDSGIFSQEYIQAEGGFKSKISNQFADQWITTTNGSVNIWNWIEVYGDVGLMKNKLQKARFVYDSGIRLNLVTDYFELYFPVYSNNGWEITQPKYAERIRFIVAFNPSTLINLFTRKWF